MHGLPALGPVERVVSRVCRLRLQDNSVPRLQVWDVPQRPLGRVLVIVAVRQLAVLFLCEACARDDAGVGLLLFFVVVDLSKQVPVPPDSHMMLVANHGRRVDRVRPGNELRMVSICVLLHGRVCLLQVGCCRSSGNTVPVQSLAGLFCLCAVRPTAGLSCMVQGALDHDGKQSGHYLSTEQN